MKPVSESCEENKEPILEVLRTEFAHCRDILEIGSGTGQHAVYFARHLQHLTWHTSDREESHAGIHAWCEESGLRNVRAPLELDVLHSTWPSKGFDGAFSANTAHIMSWSEVKAMCRGVGAALYERATFCLYGPFNYDGKYTSESNAHFDQWLKARDPASGIRDFEAVDELLAAEGFSLSRDYEMPVNNRTLVWRRSSFGKP